MAGRRTPSTMPTTRLTSIASRARPAIARTRARVGSVSPRNTVRPAALAMPPHPRKRSSRCCRTGSPGRPTSVRLLRCQRAEHGPDERGGSDRTGSRSGTLRTPRMSGRLRFEHHLGDHAAGRASSDRRSSGRRSVRAPATAGPRHGGHRHRPAPHGAGQREHLPAVSRYRHWYGRSRRTPSSRSGAVVATGFATACRATPSSAPRPPAGDAPRRPSPHGLRGPG